jgi:hypothetical protein
LPEVELAYIETNGVPPPNDIAPPTPNLSAQQSYRGANPGIDANFAAAQGLRGAGVRVSDCEYWWDAAHEDLNDIDIHPEPGQTPSSASLTFMDHGTAVVGVIASVPNAYGCSGLAPEVSIYTYTENSVQEGSRRVTAIAHAIADSAVGDIVLLEMQTTGAGGGYGPAELAPAVWTLCKMATEAGVVIVAAAGNGNQNLDSSSYATYRNMGDSGAIIVGAGSANASHDKLGFSTYGARVNVQGWGESVFTLGYGNFAVYGGDPHQEYTASFNGTSSASPLVASACALLQQKAKQSCGVPLDPLDLRALLIATGIPQGTGGHIGPLVSLSGALASFPACVLYPCGTSRVSVDGSGAQGDGDSYFASISASGRFVVLASDATNLVAGDTNGQADIFLRDRAQGTTARVSIDTAGAQANDSSTHPTISASGRSVAFQSAASNLVVSDFNGVDDVFVRDRETSKTVLVSRSSAGAYGNNHSVDPHVCASGRFVVFASEATNLVIGDSNGAQDVFLHDRDSDQDLVLDEGNGSVVRVSVDSAGIQGNAWSYSPRVSADGRHVAFWSSASNLVPGDTNAKDDVFVRDRPNTSTVRVSVSTSGAEGDDHSSVPFISDDGRYVAFTSSATNLVANDLNNWPDVFVHDRDPDANGTYDEGNGTTVLASASSGGIQGDGESAWASLSPDGLHIAFWSFSSNLVPGGNAGTPSVFLRDLVAGTTTQVDVALGGAQPDGASRYPSLSSGGEFVAFESATTNLVVSDTNGAQDVLVVNLQFQRPASYCTAGTSTSGCAAALSSSGTPSASASSGFVLSATDVEGDKSGLFFYGISGQHSAPWGLGSTSYLCVKAPTQRTTTQSSGGAAGTCDGVFTLDWNQWVSTHPTALGAPFAVGQAVDAQAWYRDPPAPKTTNLSDGLSFTVGP